MKQESNWSLSGSSQSRQTAIIIPKLLFVSVKNLFCALQKNRCTDGLFYSHVQRLFFFQFSVKTDYKITVDFCKKHLTFTEDCIIIEYVPIIITERCNNTHLNYYSIL